MLTFTGLVGVMLSLNICSCTWPLSLIQNDIVKVLIFGAMSMELTVSAFEFFYRNIQLFAAFARLR